MRISPTDEPTAQHVLAFDKKCSVGGIKSKCGTLIMKRFGHMKVEDVEVAKAIFQPTAAQKHSLGHLASGRLVAEVIEHLKMVHTWPDLLLLPDTALGPDPLYGRSNVAMVTHYQDPKDFVLFTPGWLLLARDRSFSLGVFSTVVTNFNPQGAMAQVTNDDGRSKLQEVSEGMNHAQKRWVAETFQQVLDGCNGIFADKATAVAQCVDYWTSLANE